MQPHAASCKAPGPCHDKAGHALRSARLCGRRYRRTGRHAAFVTQLEIAMDRARRTNVSAISHDRARSLGLWRQRDAGCARLVYAGRRGSARRGSSRRSRRAAHPCSPGRPFVWRIGGVAIRAMQGRPRREFIVVRAGGVPHAGRRRRGDWPRRGRLRTMFGACLRRSARTVPRRHSWISGAATVATLRCRHGPGPALRATSTKFRSTFRRHGAGGRTRAIFAASSRPRC